MSSPKWRGVNHLALVTSNMDDTVRFYAGVLGARLVATVGTPRSGTTSSTSARTRRSRSSSTRTSSPTSSRSRPACRFPRRRSSTTSRSTSSTRKRCSISATRLKNANCEVTDVVDHGFIRSIYFTDPNGIALEASYWVVDPTGHAEVSLDDPRLFGDSDPVPAVAELRAGALERVPATKLVDGFTKQAEDWIVR